MNEKYCILTLISLRFVPNIPIDNKSALVQVMVSEYYLHLITIVKGNEDEHYCGW